MMKASGGRKPPLPHPCRKAAPRIRKAALRPFCGTGASGKQHLKEPAENENQYGRGQNGYGKYLDGPTPAEQRERDEEEEEGTDGEAAVRFKGRVVHAGEEIAEFETYEERQMFLQEIGLEESGVSRLIRAAYSLLNLETYFTAGPQEVRAWTYLKGSKAPQCAGIIHTDFEKGFIRAEVIKYDDYIALGSENACKEAGKMYIEGKEYVVQDGDIMHFRFNV